MAQTVESHIILKEQQTTVLNIFSLFFKKIRLDISCESYARQRIHKKHQVLFASKDKSKKKNIKLSSAAILLGSLRINAVAMDGSHRWQHYVVCHNLVIHKF